MKPFVERFEIAEEIGVFVVLLLPGKFVNCFLCLGKGTGLDYMFQFVLVKLIDGHILQNFYTLGLAPVFFYFNLFSYIRTI